MADDPRHDFDLCRALDATIATLAEGMRSHAIDAPDYWIRVSPRAHAVRAAIHIEKFLLGLSDEEHLRHAYVRILMAVELTERERASVKEPTKDGI
jgi:hypothetical protein